MYSFDTAVKEQARLDKEITKLAHILSSLQTRKNTFAPISRLPSPILARIFIYHARHDYYSRRHDGCYTSRWMVSRWIGVSFVCRHWRKVALNCPALWGYLFVASPWWTRTLFSRSLDSPLRLRVTFYRGRHDVTLDLMARVAMNAERLRECCIKFTFTRPEASRVLLVFSQAAPLLHTLKIKIDEYDNMVGGVNPRKCDLVHADNDHVLFDGDTPLLRELELTNYGMPWRPLTPSGLTTLRLCNLAASVRATVTELRDLLRGMQHLVELHLEDAVRSDPPDTLSRDSDMFRLPSLSRLFIHNSFPEIVQILSFLEVSSTVQVRLKCHQKIRPRSDDFTLFCSLLSLRFYASTNTCFPIREVAIKILAIGLKIVFSASERYYRIDEGISIEDDSSDIPLVVNIDPWPSLNKQSDDMIADILRGIPLTHLQRVILGDCCFSSAFWVDTFWYLQELRSIKLISRGLSGLIGALSEPARPPLSNMEGPKGRGLCQVFAPALRELVLENVGFDEEWDGDSDIYPDKVWQLCYALRMRQRTADYSLRVIELIDCWYLYADGVQELVNVGGHSVDWDGRIHDGIDRSSSEDWDGDGDDD